MDPHTKLLNALTGQPSLDVLLAEHEQRQRSAKPKREDPTLPRNAHVALAEALGVPVGVVVPNDAHERLAKTLTLLG